MPGYDANLFNPPAPLAFVKIHNPDQSRSFSDVPMLLNSGADTSCLPLHAVENLNLQPDRTIHYEVEGYDGKHGVLSIVVAQLEFSGMICNGRFLILDRPWGIIGRNILKHFKVVLDGPEQSWSAEV